MLDKKIDFIICGVQKSATELLSYHLQKHPKIFMPKQEIHFFDKLNLKRKIKIFFNDYSSYHKHFNFNSNKTIYGEKTPIYIFYKDCIRQIYKYNKNIKIVLIFRDPLQRAFSHYNMNVKKFEEKLTFEDAIFSENCRINKNDYGLRTYSYIERGKYFTQISNVTNYFKMDNIFIASYDLLIENFEETIKNIINFLGIKKHVMFFKKDRITWKKPTNHKKMILSKNAKNFVKEKLEIEYYNFKKLTNISFKSFEKFLSI